ncbi:MAG: 2,3-bisphosphoglycerate-independent phosphoglycerate mutase [Dehalococcoidia bacterium]|jgi:2,3-bisphosphoglycerate-independent phosphoglycerate mutase
MDLEVIRELVVKNDTKIILLVIDGLGGLPRPETGRSELEEANTIHLDRLAADGLCGLTVPVGTGITPGSGPGHLALFGYDPLKYKVGRGVLEALGIDFDLRREDLAARGNFCTLGSDGRITDRRAGRINTETCTALCEDLRNISLPGVEVFVLPVREHRFLLVLRGKGLDDGIADTDPQRLGLAPLPAKAERPEAEASARLVNDFIAKATKVLADKHPANGLLLRGFSRWPDVPQMGDVFGLNAAAVAVYPMYRGLAKLVGMTVLPTGTAIEDEVATLEEHWQDFDFFFIHYKATDSRGEDGNYEGKVAALEEVDGIIPSLRRLNPDVMMVGGDHSTPSLLAGHSWHPVPFVIAARWCRPDRTEAFDEKTCRAGGLGLMPATSVLPLALANAQRLMKYGA